MKTTCSLSMVFGVVLLLAPAVAVGQEPNYDRTDSDNCAHCHDFTTGEPRHPADEMQHFVTRTWLLSSHANSWSEHNGNTYCMKCHAPFQADPLATHEDNVPVPIGQSQALTCTVCHPDHSLGWEPRLGIYQIGMDPEDLENPAWIPVTEPKDLCTSCHQGSRYERQLTWMKGVDCIECHMPEMPVDALDENGQPVVKFFRSHDWDFHLDDPVALAEKAEYACLPCHANWGDEYDVDWAVEQILSGMIHDDKPNADPGGPYSGVVGEPVQFDASNSSDPEDNDLTFTWTFEGDPDPVFGVTASHTWFAPGTYTATLSVTDGTNLAVVKEVSVEISPAASDTWLVKAPFGYLYEGMTVTFEPFADIIIVDVDYPDGTSSMGIGMEWDGVIYWMDMTQSIFFGNINRSAGTMSGIAFFGDDVSIWFGEKQ